MSVVGRAHDIWRKNSPELLALFNGALPSFAWQMSSNGALGGIPVFGYHCVEADVFREDLQHLQRNGYRALTADQLVARMRSEVPIADREVLLTFDDGPRNFVDVALPIIEEFGMAVTAFVAPGLLADDYGEFQQSPHRPLTWGEVRRAHASGLVAVQSHTYESRYIPAWPRPVPLAGVDPVIEQSLRKRSPLALAEDLRASQQAIEEHCPGAKVRHLCYPQYHGDDASAALAASLGFQGIYCGMIAGRPLARAGESPLAIPRLIGEFVRRLPGTGRISLAAFLGLRARAVRLGRSMRQAWLPARESE